MLPVISQPANKLVKVDFGTCGDPAVPLLTVWYSHREFVAFEYVGVLHVVRSDWPGKARKEHLDSIDGGGDKENLRVGYRELEDLWQRVLDDLHAGIVYTDACAVPLTQVTQPQVNGLRRKLHEDREEEGFVQFIANYNSFRGISQDVQYVVLANKYPEDAVDVEPVYWSMSDGWTKIENCTLYFPSDQNVNQIEVNKRKLDCDERPLGVALAQVYNFRLACEAKLNNS